MPGLLQVFQSKDKGPKKYMNLTNAPETLALKSGCRVIITHNLNNELVNGLTAKVISITPDSIEIEIDDEHLKHGMEGKRYNIEKYVFTVCEFDGTIVGTREQFPWRLGYFTSVDKVQGRTIESLVVDCYNLWKAAHMGTAIGR